MKVEMILTCTQFAGMILSFTLLLRVRRHLVGLWARESSYQPLPSRSDIEQADEIDY